MFCDWEAQMLSKLRERIFFSTCHLQFRLQIKYSTGFLGSTKRPNQVGSQIPHCANLYYITHLPKKEVCTQIFPVSCPKSPALVLSFYLTKKSHFLVFCEKRTCQANCGLVSNVINEFLIKNNDKILSKVFHGDQILKKLHNCFKINF